MLFLSSAAPITLPEGGNTHPDADLKSRHLTPADGNVFADLGFSPKDARALLQNADHGSMLLSSCRISAMSFLSTVRMLQPCRRARIT